MQREAQGRSLEQAQLAQSRAQHRRSAGSLQLPTGHGRHSLRLRAMLRSPCLAGVPQSLCHPAARATPHL